MKLSEKQLEIITRVAGEVAIEKYKSEQEEQEKQKHDRRLRNVKLLIKNYRSFAKHSADIKLEIVELDEKLALADLDTDENAIMSIRRSKRKTLAMVKFINKTLQVYKLMCEQDGTTRNYEAIYHLYISDEKKTVSEISELQNVVEKTVYNNINKAYEDLTVLVFGVDGLRF